MNKIFSLTKRHMKNYLRDKSSVFFSFLSIIILLLIYLLFLKDVFSNNSFLSDSENNRFVMGYIMGGVLVVGTITLSLGVIGTYVSDLEKKRIDGFLVAPVNRKSLTISYFLSTAIVTFVLSVIMFLLAVVIIGVSSGYWYGVVTILSGIGIMFLYVLISTPIILFLITFIKTSGAFGGLSSIVGTLIGFVSGIYIPLSNLDAFTSNIASILPFSHMTIFLRKMLIGKDIVAKLPYEAMEGYSINNLKIFNLSINFSYLFIIFSAISVVFLVLAYLRINKKSKN